MMSGKISQIYSRVEGRPRCKTRSVHLDLRTRTTSRRERDDKFVSAHCEDRNVFESRWVLAITPPPRPGITFKFSFPSNDRDYSILALEEAFFFFQNV